MKTAEVVEELQKVCPLDRAQVGLSIKTVLRQRRQSAGVEKEVFRSQADITSGIGLGHRSIFASTIFVKLPSIGTDIGMRATLVVT